MTKTQKKHFGVANISVLNRGLVIIILGLLFFLTGSWKKSSENKEESFKPNFRPKPSLLYQAYFPAFVMEKNQVNTYLTAGKGLKKIILRYSLKGMIPDRASMKIIAYWAVDQTQHGQEGATIPPYVLDPDTKANGDEIISTQKYILGNSYLKISKIDKYLKSLEGGENNYDYMRFTLVLPETSNNLVFLVQACKSDGTIVKQKPAFRKFLDDPGGIITNPSPPAKPGED